jgi:predicted kinase
MKKLFIIVGEQGSGKSLYIKNHRLFEIDEMSAMRPSKTLLMHTNNFAVECLEQGDARKIEASALKYFDNVNIVKIENPAKIH